MFFSQQQPPTRDAGPVTPPERWLQAVTGHLCFSVLASLLLSLSTVPMLLCIYGFFRTGALVFTLGWVLAGGVAGPVFAALQRAAYELQYGMLCYPGRSLFRWLRASIRQGAALGVLGALLWTLLLSPLWLLAAAGGPGLPLWLLVLLAAGAVVLACAGGYAFYQAVRWELSLPELCRNSLLLLFGAGGRAFLSGVVWLVLPAGLLLWYPVVLPLSVVAGLPMVMSITAQALFAPAIDGLMDQRRQEGTEEDGEEEQG